VPGTFNRPGLAAFLVLLALMAAARLVELAWARRLTERARARGAAPQPEPAFVAMVVLHTLPFWLAPLEVILLGRPFIPLLFAGVVAALVVLAGLRVWTLYTLGAMWNVRIVAPAHTVTSGPYRYVRHPNYAIVVAELALLPLAHAAWVTALIVSTANALVLAARITAEERLLLALPSYRETMGGKPRFIPRLRPWGSLRATARAR
jgi:methyltransferase